MIKENKTWIREKNRLNRLVREIYNLRLAIAISFAILNLFATNREKPETKPYRIPKYEIMSVEYYNNFSQIEQPLTFESSPFFQRLANKRAEYILNSWYDKGVYEWSRTLFTQYDDYADKVGCDLDRSLLESLVFVESPNVDTRAISPTGPRGLGQFAKETAIRNGAYISEFIDERYDPEVTLTILIPNHLNEILQMYKNININDPSLEQVLYTYNKGGLTILHGEKLYDNISDTLRYYITEVNALRKLIKDDSLNYELMPLYSKRVKNADIYIFREGDSLGEIALSNNTSSQKIVELNPVLKNPGRIPNGYPLRVPKEL